MSCWTIRTEFRTGFHCCIIYSKLSQSNHLAIFEYSFCSIMCWSFVYLELSMWCIVFLKKKWVNVRLFLSINNENIISWSKKMIMKKSDLLLEIYETLKCSFYINWSFESVCSFDNNIDICRKHSWYIFVTKLIKLFPKFLFCIFINNIHHTFKL